jgi:hypothetical protein
VRACARSHPEPEGAAPVRIAGHAPAACTAGKRADDRADLALDARRQVDRDRVRSGGGERERDAADAVGGRRRLARQLHLDGVRTRLFEPQDAAGVDRTLDLEQREPVHGEGKLRRALGLRNRHVLRFQLELIRDDAAAHGSAHQARVHRRLLARRRAVRFREPTQLVVFLD